MMLKVVASGNRCDMCEVTYPWYDSYYITVRNQFGFWNGLKFVLGLSKVIMLSPNLQGYFPGLEHVILNCTYFLINL